MNFCVRRKGKCNDVGSSALDLFSVEDRSQYDTEDKDSQGRISFPAGNQLLKGPHSSAYWQPAVER
ncbi:alpha--mannosylglycoprotein 6-beta-n-acetylglucosaminyltransferase a [Moniliophthora roreri]|nr:alpha--mannosylglycoprotein 6-beta-n-acetylglucosaminyltransferase a [Moniliophthora roreri]